MTTARMLTLAIVLLLAGADPLYPKIVGRELTYSQGGTNMLGYVTYDDSMEGKRPGVLVVHEWWGHNAYARLRADMLAKLGYVAFVLDMYGSGKTAEHPKTAKQFSTSLMSDLVTAEMRFDAALIQLREHPLVDRDRVAAIGYCFGGGIVLNMALMGSDVDGVISFHGSLPTVDPTPADRTTAAILVCNGAEDPLITNEQIQQFRTICQQQGINLTFENYPNAKHSFTNPKADEFAEEFDLPVGYNAQADKQSWLAMQDFLRRIFQ